MTRARSVILWLLVAIDTFFCAWIAIFGALFARVTNMQPPRSWWIIDFISRFWAQVIFVVAGVRIYGQGLESLKRIKGPVVVMSNHQSHLDPPLLIALMPIPLRFVAKSELRSIPVFGTALEAAGHVYIDRSDRRSAIDSMHAAIQRLSDHVVGIVIYPEGTRSDKTEMLAFKKGGFMMALDGGIPIVPVGIRGTARVLPPRSLRVRRGNRVAIHVGDPIDVAQYGHERRLELMNDVRQAIEELRGDQSC